MAGQAAPSEANTREIGIKPADGAGLAALTLRLSNPIPCVSVGSISPPPQNPEPGQGAGFWILAEGEEAVSSPLHKST